MPCRFGFLSMAFVFSCHSGSFHPLRNTSRIVNRPINAACKELICCRRRAGAALPCEGHDGRAAFSSIQGHFVVGEERAAWNKTSFVVLKGGGEDTPRERAYDGTDCVANAIFLCNESALVVHA